MTTGQLWTYRDADGARRECLPPAPLVSALWCCIALLNDGHVAGEPVELSRLQDGAEELVELAAVEPLTDAQVRDARAIVAYVKGNQTRP